MGVIPKILFAGMLLSAFVCFPLWTRKEDPEMAKAIWIGYAIAIVFWLSLLAWDRWLR